jgi:hypothetical protein
MTTPCYFTIIKKHIIDELIAFGQAEDCCNISDILIATFLSNSSEKIDNVARQIYNDYKMDDELSIFENDNNQLHSRVREYMDDLFNSMYLFQS